ncbi:AfsR/SARP family transcriptional regulator [Kribbella shirazensis]|uniref:Putative ATPase/DNA-binding SARP family transcriptional activator n=1 Tax=Kribbella shirazensis TaxID=1105143 RepID=A0A7X6A221_9ACTN|nr:BTAD domain-containing putative transcriptional regulator [Kribbella shirazensis]NIK58821.1 putative ATPase/DNA-binding SARP family transcriptional activator [Kribbella shirazensis]
MGQLDIRLLGPFEVRRDGWVVPVPGRKVRALLAVLALHCGRTVPVDVLGRALWADDPPQRLRGSLQTYVGRLRRVLGDDAIATEPTGYRLDLPPECVDVRRFHQLLDAGNPEQALTLWRGDPFASAISPWLEEHDAPALVERYLTAWEQLPDPDIPELHKLTTRYPFRETLWLRLFTALRDAGRSAEALDRYETFRTHLADELGTDPTPELQAIHRSLLQGHPTDTRQGLPHDLTRFFGRDEELLQLDRLLRSSRLVTIAGAPGAGKTRLSREFAVRFADRVVLAELALAPSVQTAVDEALGETDPADLLLILDNCEHMATAAAELVGRMLASCPSLRILTTSRVPLGASGEQVYRLPPLAPAPAIELFADRAALVAGAHPQDRSTVDLICRRLDGLPLAIELAAAWSRVLSPRQILDRLTPLLQDAPGGQRTMSAAIDWSYHLLSAPQQLLFERLAVFTGGFDLAAVEAVAGLGDELLGALTGLVDHSLVLTVSLHDGHVRYRLLEPVRQYAASLLGDSPSLRARHAAHYLTVAQQGDANLRGPDPAATLIGLQPDEANLLSASSWARTQPGDLVLRLATATAYFWEHRAYVNDARSRLEEFLDRGDPALRASALTRLGRLAWRQRDYAAAKAAYEQSLALRLQLGDEPGTARALRNLALVAASTGQTSYAVELCQQSIARFRRSDDDQGRGWTLTVLALAHFEDGEWDLGAERYREALTLSGSNGGSALALNARLGLAYAAAATGDVRTHRAQLTAIVAHLRKASGLIEDPEWLWASTSLAAAEGRHHAALRLAGAATTQRSGSPEPPPR